MARHAAGEFEFAAGEYRAILALDPRDINVLFHLGIAEHQLHNFDQAAAVLEKVTSLAPDFAEGWQSLGAVQLDRGQTDSAVAAGRKALALKPVLHGARLRLVAALLETDRAGEAMDPLLTGLRMTPAQPRLWRCLETCLNSVLAGRNPDAWRHFIPADFPQLAAQAVASGCVLRGNALNGVLLNFLTDVLGRLAGRLGDSLAVLENPAYSEAEILSLPLEQTLSRIRRDALAALHAGNVENLSASIAGLAGLANIQFRHEYVSFVSDTENRQAEILGNCIDTNLERGLVNAVELAVFACYRPLCSLQSAKRLLPGSIPAGCEALGSVLRQQVWEPLNERQIAASMVSITPIRHATSIAVSAMYEENPYPRWKNLPIQIDPVDSYAKYLEVRLPGARLPEDPAPGEFEILIAGCGTGRQLMATAMLRPSARIMAVDLCRASLAYARRKMDEIELPHIELAQADILELGTLGRRFPYIECCGVLHHLEEPAAGLRVLSSLLEPGGVIQLALYSRTAREHFGILRAQQFAKEHHYTGSADDIRRLRMELVSDPQALPDGRILEVRDFYFLSQCRDLLLHEMEHCFTPAEIGRFCAGAGLDFLGFEEPAPGTFERYAAQFPEDVKRVNLDNWALMEAAEPGLFIGMYVFYAQKPWSKAPLATRQA